MDISFLNESTLLPNEDNSTSFVTSLNKKHGFKYTTALGFYTGMKHLMNLGINQVTIHANKKRYFWDRRNGVPSLETMCGENFVMYEYNLNKIYKNIISSLKGKTLLTFDSSPSNIKTWAKYEKIILINMLTPVELLQRRIKYSGTNPHVIHFTSETNFDSVKAEITAILNGDTPDVGEFFFVLSKFNFEHKESYEFIKKLIELPKASTIVEYNINKLYTIENKLDYKFPLIKKMTLNRGSNLNGIFPSWSFKRFSILGDNEERYQNDYSTLLLNSKSHEFSEKFMSKDERVLASSTLINTFFNYSNSEEDEEKEQDIDDDE